MQSTIVKISIFLRFPFPFTTFDFAFIEFYVFPPFVENYSVVKNDLLISNYYVNICFSRKMRKIRRKYEGTFPYFSDCVFHETFSELSNNNRWINVSWTTMKNNQEIYNWKREVWWSLLVLWTIRKLLEFFCLFIILSTNFETFQEIPNPILDVARKNWSQ